MAAILGLADDKVVELCQSVSALGQGSVEAANYNSQGQVVIAGSTASVQQVMALAKEQSAKAIVFTGFCSITLFIDEAGSRKICRSFGTNCH